MSLPTLAQRDPGLGIGITPRAQFPGVADYIERHGVHGRLFTHFHMGGYLLLRFWPERLPFMDIHQAGTVEDQNAYVLALAREDWWRRLDGRYRFEVVALDRHSVADSLMCFLERDPAWALVFLDDGAALYLKHGPRSDSLIAATGYALVAASKPGAGLVAARAEADTALRRRLVADLERMARSSQDNASAYSMLANMAMLDGRWELARDHLERGRRVDPALPRYHERVGLLALVQGDAPRALAAFHRELRDHPGLADLEARVGEAHLALGDTALARRQFLKELGLHPANRLARARLETIGER
jgi:tetratricopeptide (TPR) repeat protein